MNYFRKKERVATETEVKRERVRYCEVDSPSVELDNGLIFPLPFPHLFPVPGQNLRRINPTKNLLTTAWQQSVALKYIRLVPISKKNLCINKKIKYVMVTF